ncbi:hypothetical protein E1281_25885, partial [Actinomadura sp. KC345]|uniref:glycerol-3-phosphate dehydrogenase/oxidase n=1 Tax=Actinomadura sp. KC345 TaxID=2530371 RepID=UPI0010EF3413
MSQNKQAIGDLFNLLLMMVPTAIRMVSLLVKAWDALTNLPGIPMLIAGLGKLSGRTDESRGAVDEFGNSLEGTNRKATAAEQALSKFRDETQKLANLALQARGGVAGMEQAIDDATKAVKENGRTLNLNTQAGRDNDEALRNLASSTLTMKESMLESGRSVEEVDRKTRRAREAFVQTAMQMGLTKKEAQDLADKYGLIPNAKTTSLQAKDDTAPGIKSAEEKGQGWASKTWTSVVNAADRAWGGINSAKERARGWASSVWTSTVNAADRAWRGINSAKGRARGWAT